MLKNLVNITILTTIVIVVWAGISIYLSFTQSTISSNVEEQINPITPQFNSTTVSSLQQRTFIPVDLSEQIITPEENPDSPTPTPQTGLTQVIPEQPLVQQIQSETPATQGSILSPSIQ